MRSIIFLLGIVLVSFSSYAQKVKYKDLYVLLRAKNYKDASGFLKSYLLEDPEHPNANYQMGLMLEHNLEELDILRELSVIISRADSSILYFNKAHDFITEKEIKKHDDDYYELFKRRNLRTGKFEVILSDIQLDIEDRITKISDYKSDVEVINKRFNSGVQFYELARLGYKKLKEQFKDELSLSLGAFDSTSITLSQMSINFDSAMINLKEYKKLKKILKNAGINDVILNSKEIETFSESVLTVSDFYANKIDLYNFHDWSKNQLIKINSNKEFVNELIKFDESLEKIANKIEEDSVDLSSDIFKKITSPILKELKFVDYESLLTKLFQYKISQLNFNSVWMEWHTNYADTLDVGLQLNYVNKLKAQLNGVAKLVERLNGYDEALFSLRYNRFISTRYKNIDNFNNYIANQNELVAKEKERVDVIEKEIEAKDKWGYWNEDKLSLVVNTDSILTYTTVYTDSLNNREVSVAGFKVDEVDTLFYYALVPSSRRIDTLFQVPLPIPLVKDSLSYIEFSSYKTSNNQCLFLITKKVGEALVAGLMNASSTDGVTWSVPVQLLTLEKPTLTIEEDKILLQQGEVLTVYQLNDGTPIVNDELQPEE